MAQNNKKAVKIQPKGLFSTVKSTLYGYLLAIGLGWFLNFIAGQNLHEQLNWKLSYRILPIALVSFCILVALNFIFEVIGPGFKKHRTYLFSQIVQHHSMTSHLYLASITAFAEEFIFRGAIQPTLGPLCTSLLACLFHLAPSGVISIWTVYSLVFHFFMCMLYALTTSLWPCILTNILISVFLVVQTKKLIGAQT